ncbi:bactericidal permeability-increasing protein [Megalops cyprinoides]|uniref:bactericidal permeability-increasing protein n=1 Tax=Megalops cyprinoides TaxID=118141 RepID=UPI001863F3CE|nr:bactericidal permeability-increasing protein [Megalops cyprinoides]XP_036389159.1 bactericidal permeability-increasing protein [Megalops cyprinoides]
MWLCLCSLLSLSAGTFGHNPAIKAVLTDKGLQYGARVVMDWLQSRIEQMSVPDISGRISIGFLGSVHYTLSNINVVQVDLPVPIVAFSEGTGIKMAVSGFNIALHGNWHTSFHIIRDGGTFDLAVYNIDLSSLLRLRSDEQGHPSISTVQCDSNIGGTEMNFYGGASWIFKHFVSRFEGYINAQIKERICPMIEQNIESLESHLAAMKVSFQVTPNLLIEIPLLSPPLVQSTSTEMDFKGEFYSVKGHTEPPFAAGPFQLPGVEHCMVTLGVSEFCANSATFAYFSAGLLQKNITDSMIPKLSPIRLNTTSFGTFIPQLPKLFPNMLMLLQVFAANMPTVSFLPDSVTLGLFGSVKAYAIKPDSSLAPLFRLDMNASFSGRFFIVDKMLRGALALDNMTLALGSSEIGTFQTASLAVALQTAINMAVLPELNAKLKTGIPLPETKYVQWVNPVLKVNKGFVMLATDTKISPPGDQER